MKVTVFRSWFDTKLFIEKKDHFQVISFQHTSDDRQSKPSTYRLEKDDAIRAMDAIKLEPVLYLSGVHNVEKYHLEIPK